MGVSIRHKRKSGAFVGGELGPGELGLDISSGQWFYSLNGSSVAIVFAPTGLARYFRHGGNASKARPLYAGAAWPGPVVWRGTVEPTNAIDGDQWQSVDLGEE